MKIIKLFLLISIFILLLAVVSAWAFNAFRYDEQIEPQNFIIVLVNKTVRVKYKYIYPAEVGVFFSNYPLEMKAGGGYWPSELNQKYDFYPYTSIFMIKSKGGKENL